MTTVTKEQAIRQLDAIKNIYPLSFVRTYLTQLEERGGEVTTNNNDDTIMLYFTLVVLLLGVSINIANIIRIFL